MNQSTVYRLDIAAFDEEGKASEGEQQVLSFSAGKEAENAAKIIQQLENNQQAGLTDKKHYEVWLVAFHHGEQGKATDYPIEKLASASVSTAQEAFELFHQLKSGYTKD